jgi:hypothetical protein
MDMYDLCNIDMELLLGVDDEVKNATNTPIQLLLEKLDVEGYPLIHSIEQMMHQYTNHALFLGYNLAICMEILNALDIWLSRRFGEVDNTQAFRHEGNLFIVISTTEQHKSQQHVKLSGYAK